MAIPGFENMGQRRVIDEDIIEQYADGCRPNLKPVDLDFWRDVNRLWSEKFINIDCTDGGDSSGVTGGPVFEVSPLFHPRRGD